MRSTGSFQLDHFNAKLKAYNPLFHSALKFTNFNWINRATNALARHDSYARRHVGSLWPRAISQSLNHRHNS